MKFPIVYIGTSSAIIEQLFINSDFQIQTVICEKKRITEEYLKVVKKCQLPLLTFTNKENFEHLILTFALETIFLIYQLDLIVSETLTNRYTFFNLHSGSLKTNRGAHPIIRSILNNDSSTEFTLHKINDKIDQGTMVSAYPIQISQTDDVVSIKNKMEEGFPYIFGQLSLFLVGNLEGTEISGGKYYKPISESDFTVKPFIDSQTEMLNKIRSQRQYKGAVIYIADKKYFTNNLISWKSQNNPKESIVIDENVIIVERKNETITFQIIE